jgi:phospholipase/carboxylesterase
MDKLKMGSLEVRAAGGSDRKGGGDGPAVLLCHGFGAQGDDLVSFARAVDAGRDVRWFFPEGPLAIDVGFGMEGRAFWNIDILRFQRLAMMGNYSSLMEETPEGLAEAREKLEAVIATLEGSYGVRRDRLVIGGFSQGAMLSAEVALHAERPFAGIALLSGALVSTERWRSAAATSGPSIRAFMSHGRADPIIPFAVGEALRALLEQSGAQVDWVPHNGQHEIPSVVVDRLGAFLRARFA